ncbi:MAG: hypothetical protein NT045_01015 [Candidatus Aureabacteria bacterium]|nr:hypothetical protein [Candidatus Auribacterota bacterium]
MSRQLFPRARLRWLIAASALSLSGCAMVSMVPVSHQDSIYPRSLAPGAPLVLAIPGLRVPGLEVTQEQHFGRLVEMLAGEGIPCRILTYDTAENPLHRGAALFDPDLAIAWTRVGPSAVHELELENERRTAAGLPEVKRLVFIGYSQGGVIMSQLATRIFHDFKNNYEEMARQFGNEWEALRNDPEFIYFLNDLEDYLVIRNIKVQRERDFARDPDFRAVYRRAEAKANRRLNDLVEYLLDPSRRYPGVTRFEGPASASYPKRYEKIGKCAGSFEHCSMERRRQIRDFFADYAEYRAFLTVKPYFASLAGSFFGSPRADESVTLFKWFPPLKLFARRELVQIEQSRLGTLHQLDFIQTLARLNRDRSYPINPDNSLFLVGADGSRGDGLVDQSSAHLSDHTYEEIRVRKGAHGPAVDLLERDRLPDLTVVPLPVRHFPERMFGGLGGRRYGVACMEAGNPVYPFLLNFIREDRDALTDQIRGCGGSLRQFMLEIAVPGKGWGMLNARQCGVSDNIHIDNRYDNTSSRIAVWTGHFRHDEQMNLLGDERFSGVVEVEVRVPHGGWIPLRCAVYPGCNSFVKLVVE